MKKVLSIIAALLLCVGTQAQIVSSRSSIVRTEKQQSNKQWFIRGGLNMMNMSGSKNDEWGGDDQSSKLGYNFMFGFQKPISTIGTYWGMEFGLGSRGWKESDDSYSENNIAHNIQVSPFTFGYKYNVTDDIAIDAHLGVYASFDYAGKSKYEDKDNSDYNEESKIGDWDDWKRFDAGMNIGIGIWYDRFNFDITYQRGFIKTWEANSSNVLIRLGIAF